MAAVTVDSVVDTVFGNKVVRMAQIDIAANNDTWESTLNVIDHISITPNNASLAQVGATISDGTVTFKTGGAENNVKVMVIGDGA